MKRSIEEAFTHNIKERVGQARLFHEIARVDEEQKETSIETIEACKDSFHVFLEMVHKNESSQIPKPYTRESLKNIQEKSKFDWKDREKFMTFYDYLEKKYKI